MKFLSHEDFTRLHPSQFETPERLATLLEHFEWSRGRSTQREDLLRCHTPAHVERIASIQRETWLDGDTVASATSFEAALLAAGDPVHSSRVATRRARVPMMKSAQG